MHRFRTPTTLIAVACVTGLLASDVRAQLFRRPSPPPAPPAAATDPAQAAASGNAPGTPSRGARQLLRNGLDYLDKYGDPARALSYFKEAKRQQADLTAAEKQSLETAVARAQRILAGNEAARAPIARSAPASSLMRDTTRGSLLDEPGRPAALAAKPIKADRSIQTTSAPDLDPGLELAPSASTSLKPTAVADPADEPAPLTLPEPPPSLDTPGKLGDKPVAAPAAAEPPAALGLTILTGADDPLSLASPSPAAVAATAPVAPAELEPAVEPATPRLKASEVADEVLTLTMPEASEDPAVSSASADLPDEVPTLKVQAEVGAQGLPALPDGDDIPELRVTPIDGSDAHTSSARIEEVEPAQRPLLLPPPAPRPAQRLGGIEVRDTAAPAMAEETLPTLPSEPAPAPAPAVITVPAAELPAGVATPALDVSEPEPRKITLVEPGQTGRSNADPASIPLAPAPAADELAISPGAGLDSLPSLPKPPAALPQPRAAVGASDPADSLPQLPTNSGEAMPTSEGQRAPVVLPDAIPGSGQPQIRVRRAETLREVEELARRQTAEARVAAEAAGPADAAMRREDASADLPRAPSATEARPIKPIDIPEEFIPLEKRNFGPQRKFWAAPAICHTPLYFQDAALERYGQSVEQALGPHLGQTFSYPLDDPRQSIQRQQMLQPAYSAGMFALQILALPYNLIMDPPWEAQYDLGYYRPGDPIPPDTTYLPTTGVGPPLRGRKY